MTDPKLYPPHHPWELEPYYSRHVEAMTSEDLHSKSDIAIQLAWRDERIADLELQLKLLADAYQAAGDKWAEYKMKYEQKKETARILGDTVFSLTQNVTELKEEVESLSCDKLALDVALEMRRTKEAELEAENNRLKARRFRIQDGPSIPWQMIAPHEQQAIANHDQSLERLHQRGGLCCSEVIAVLESRPWRSMTDEQALKRLAELVAAFERPTNA